MKNKFLILFFIASLMMLAIACGKKQDNQGAEAAIDSAAQTSDTTPEAATQVKKYSAFVEAVRAAATKRPDLQTLLSDYGDYQVVNMPYDETPETFIQPTTEAGAANDAHIHGYTVVNNFTFVLGSIDGLRGQQFAHLLVFDADNREVVGEFMVGGGMSDGMNTYYTDAKVDRNNVITVTENVAKVDDNGNSKDEITSKKSYQFDFTQKKFVEL